MMAHMRHGKGKGVTLVGRWEGTARVLKEEITDLVRRDFRFCFERHIPTNRLTNPHSFDRIYRR